MTFEDIIGLIMLTLLPIAIAIYWQTRKTLSE